MYKYKAEYSGEKLIVKGIESFNLEHIFECGQCFRWNKEKDGSYTGVAFGKVINLKLEEDILCISNATIEDFYNIWYDYFDLDRNYDYIKKKLSVEDNVLKKAVTHGYGIRILNQDEWETLISFIISQNRSISLIKKSIELLCEKYGSYIGEYRGKKFYDFPKPVDLMCRSIEEIQETKTGYRAKYICSTAYKIAKKEVDLYALFKLDTSEARNNLLLLSGVGPKVADCILLFSMKKYDSFPKDVWVKRVMEYFYFKENTSLNKIEDLAKQKFGELSGFAQQYLFYYARELGIGK